MPWIKFHEQITKGAKRGIRRAHRFVFLELALAVRPGRGTIELPLGMNDVDGVLDLLGGDTKEVRDALAILTAGKEPMVMFSGETGARLLHVPSWQTWNSVEAAGASTERSRRHRGKGNDAGTVGNGPSDGEATETQRPATIVATPRNDRSPSDQRREDQIRTSEVVVSRPDSSPREESVTGTTTTDDPTIRAIHAELGKHPKLAKVSALSVAEGLSNYVNGGGSRLDDVVEAIRACAFDVEDGLVEHRLKAALRTYVSKAKSYGDARRAKDQAGPGPTFARAARGTYETQDDAGELEAIERRQREFQAAAEAAQARGDVSKI